MAEWQRAVEYFSGANIKLKARRLGAESMTKSCYYSEEHPEWVCLVASDAKKRILQAEVTQLLALKAHLPVVSIGPKESVEEAMFACFIEALPATAFLEAKLEDYVEVKVYSDFSGDWFYEHVIKTLQRKGEPGAWARVKESLAAFTQYLADHADGIPDMQVAFERNAARLVLFDPGDPENSESRRDKDAAALRKWSQLFEHESARALAPPKPRVGAYPLAQPVVEPGAAAAKPKAKGFCEHGEPAALCKRCQ